MQYLPFELQDSHFAIIADVSEPKIAQLFETYDYESNGYCWEGHILLILEKVAPDLVAHIDFDPEADMFVALADSAENQKRFVEVLAPIFQDLELLKSYITAADPDMIDS